MTERWTECIDCGFNLGSGHLHTPPITEMLPAGSECPKCGEPMRQVMPVEDHLVALGEAEAEKVAETRRAVRDAEAVARQESVRLQTAERELAGLREGLARESEVLLERAKFAEQRWADESRRSEVRCSARGEQLTAIETAARLAALLDTESSEEEG